MTVKDYLVAKGYSAGDIITNPNNENETYLVGKRGRCPLWLMTLAGVPSKNKIKAAKVVVPLKVPKSRSGSSKTAQGCITLTNGSFIVNGQAVYVGEDAEIEIPAGAGIACV